VPRYEVNASWDDPYERLKNRRRAVRARACLPVRVEAHNGGERRLIGTGLSENLSYNGMALLTRYPLALSEKVWVSIPTDAYTHDLFLPAEFEGEGEVVRVETTGEGQHRVALRFGSQFTENMEFAVFAEALLTGSFSP